MFRWGGKLILLPSPGLVLHLVVSGIYQTQIDPLDRGIAFCPLTVLRKGLPWSAAVFLQRGINPQEIIDRYRQKWPGNYRFESWETMMPDLRQLIDLEAISMSIVIILVFAVVAVGIACSFVIFIIKNMREYGIMKAMGVTSGEMSFLIVMKVALDECHGLRRRAFDRHHRGMGRGPSRRN